MLRLRSLAALGLCAGCAQIIGLSDYEKVDGDGFGGSSSSKGGSSSGKGGSSSKGGSGGDTGEGGEMTGTGGVVGEGGALGTEGGALGAGGKVGGLGGKAGTGGVLGKGGAAPGSGGSLVGAGGSLVGVGGSVLGAGGSVAPGTGGATTGSGGAGSCVVQTVDLLAPTGAFDTGTIPLGTAKDAGAVWYQGSSEGIGVVESSTTLATYGITPYSSPRAVILGGIGDYAFSDGSYGRESWIGKVVTIPASALAITFSCYVQVSTLETTTTTNYDYLDMWLWDDAAGKSAYRFIEGSNLDAPLTPWTFASASVPSDSIPTLAGRTLSAEIYSLVDDDNATYFFVDSCSLKVTYCN